MRTSSLPDTALTGYSVPDISLANTVAGAEFELTGGVPPELLDEAQRQARSVGYAQGWAQGLREAAAGKAVLAEQARLEQAAVAEQQAAQVGSAVQAARGPLSPKSAIAFTMMVCTYGPGKMWCQESSSAADAMTGTSLA